MAQGLLPAPLVALILGRDALLVAGCFAARSQALSWQWPGMAEFFRLGPPDHAQVMRLHAVLRTVLYGNDAHNRGVQVKNTARFPGLLERMLSCSRLYIALFHDRC